MSERDLDVETDILRIEVDMQLRPPPPPPPLLFLSALVFLVHARLFPQRPRRLIHDPLLLKPTPIPPLPQPIAVQVLRPKPLDRDLQRAHQRLRVQDINLQSGRKRVPRAEIPSQTLCQAAGIEARRQIVQATQEVVKRRHCKPVASLDYVFPRRHVCGGEIAVVFSSVGLGFEAW